MDLLDGTHREIVSRIGMLLRKLSFGRSVREN